EMIDLARAEPPGEEDDRRPLGKLRRLHPDGAEWQPTSCAVVDNPDVRDEHDKTARRSGGEDQDDGMTPERRAGSAERFIAEMADREKGDEGDQGVDQVPARAGGPLPVRLTGDRHRRGLNHYDAQPEQPQHAKGKNVAMAEAIDGVVHVLLLSD